MDMKRSITQTLQRVSADFFTNNYRISATTIVHRYSLVTSLNESNTPYLNLMSIYVSRINKPGEIIGSYPRGTINADEVNFVLLPDKAQQTDSGSPFNANAPALPVFITLSNFEIQGSYQFRGDRNTTTLLTDTPRKFIPVMDATARNATTVDIYFQSPVIIVNKTKIELLCVEGK